MASLSLMLKALIADIERAKASIKLDRIVQKLAVVEMELEQLKQNKRTEP